MDQDYDALDRLVATLTYPGGNRASLTFYVLDENGNRKEVQDPRGLVWKTEFDNLNRPVKAVNPPNPFESFRTMSYDAFGNLRHTEDESGQTRTFAHDLLNRPTQETITGGGAPPQTLLYSHDGADRRTKEVTTLGLGGGSVHRYNALSRLMVQEDLIAVGATLIPFRTLSYEYTPAGDRKLMTSDDPKLGRWAYAFDEDHLLKTLSHLPGHVTQVPDEVHGWTYDQGMRQKTHAMSNGCVETRTYDAKERLQRLLVKTSSNVTLSDLGYGFDKVDNRTSITYAHLGGGIQRFGYDGEYRLVSETMQGGSLPFFHACYGYDPNGNRLFKSGSAGMTVSSYDNENRLSTETAYSGFAQIPAASITASSTAPGYSTLPIADGLTPDGTLPLDAWASESLPAQHSAELEFSAPVAVGKIKLWLPTGNGLARRFKVQGWDGSNWQDILGQAEGAVLEPSGWLRQTAHEVTLECLLVVTSRLRFLQDAGGGAPGSPDQAFLNEFQAFEPTGASTTSLAYAPAGLLLSESGPSGVTDYGYDWGYRLSSYQKGSTSASYVSDAMGRRFLKTATTPSGTSAFRFALDGEDVIGDYAEGPGNLAVRYTNGLGIDQKLSIGRGSLRFDFVADALGSTHELLSQAQGVAMRHLYSAWGEDLQTTGGIGNRYRHGGRELDSETGLYFHRNRTRHSGRGGFDQRDPSRSWGGNDWSYVGNNPANATDPTGRDLKIGNEPVTGGSPFYTQRVHDPKTPYVGDIMDAMIRASRIKYTYLDAAEFDMENRLRHAVIESAQALQGSGAQFASGTAAVADQAFWDSPGGFCLRFKSGPGADPTAALRSIFSGDAKHPGQTQIDCGMAVAAIYWDARRKTVPPNMFSKAVGKYGLVISDNSVPWLHPGLSDVVPGDSVYFRNYPGYEVLAPGGAWGGEHAISMGNRKYYGFGIGLGETPDFQDKLEKEYNGAVRTHNQANPREQFPERHDQLGPPEPRSSLYLVLRGLNGGPK